MIELLLQADRALTVGFLDQAEGIYRTVAERDPRNAMAVTGLARVALERGDEPGAHALAVRALDIDPQDSVALRLEARISEILATRGKPVERPAGVRPAVRTDVRPEVQVGPARPREALDEGSAADDPRPGLLRKLLGR